MRFVLISLVAISAVALAQVTPDNLVHASAESQNWLTYWGDYAGTRYRKLDQINTGNVARLRAEWMFQTGKTGAFETVPLVVDGVMYLTAGDGVAMALDARSGRQLWRYTHKFPAGHNSTGVNRGLGILGDRLFMVNPDATVVALDAHTGDCIWQAEMAPPSSAHYATLAPLVVNDKVIVGISGGEQGVRGFIDAYNAQTGKRDWRFYTVPLAKEPGGDTWLADSAERGGGPAWMTGTYDPDLRTVYWGIGNPGPDLFGDIRKGDNLYTCSLVALDVDTGKLKWHFQFTPHDTHDWDAAETPMLIDALWNGQMRKLVVQANRNAFFYVLDRQTGDFLKGYPFVRQTWARGLDDKGRPIVLPNTEPSTKGTLVCPGLVGGTNFMAPSYNPETKLFYFSVRDQCDVFYSSPPVFKKGQSYWGTAFRADTKEKGTGMLKALDPLTGKTAWQFLYYQPTLAGTLATSGGLVFAGDEDGYAMAFDAKTGKNLWKLNTGNRIVSSPITYMLGQRQYVTYPSGGVLITFALPEDK